VQSGKALRCRYLWATAGRRGWREMDEEYEDYGRQREGMDEEQGGKVKRKFPELQDHQ